jgi:hypothetical protein
VWKQHTNNAATHAKKNSLAWTAFTFLWSDLSSTSVAHFLLMLSLKHSRRAFSVLIETGKAKGKPQKHCWYASLRFSRRTACLNILLPVAIHVKPNEEAATACNLSQWIPWRICISIPVKPRGLHFSLNFVLQSEFLQTYTFKIVWAMIAQLV